VAGAGDDPGDEPVVDEAATAARRAQLAAARGETRMFDRGPGYPLLAGGATHAEVDDDGGSRGPTAPTTPEVTR
jgi:N-methylhydantoinase B